MWRERCLGTAHFQRRAIDVSRSCISPTPDTENERVEDAQQGQRPGARTVLAYPLDSGTRLSTCTRGALRRQATPRTGLGTHRTRGVRRQIRSSAEPSRRDYQPRPPAAYLREGSASCSGSLTQLCGVLCFRSVRKYVFLVYLPFMLVTGGLQPAAYRY